MIDSYPELKELLQACLNFDYKKRPSADDIFNSAFFAGFTTE